MGNSHMTRHALPCDPHAERILKHHGERQQVLKAIEELNECAARLAKELNECAARLAKDLIEHHTGTSALDVETVEEIADATLMLRQMRFLYGWASVDAAIERKLERTLKRMEE